MAFSVPRLEGRAWEHSLAQQPARLGIRMKEKGTWKWIRTTKAMEIRKDINERCCKVLEELGMHGLHRRRADVQVKVKEESAEKEHSVDLVLFYQELGEILVETKWSRKSLSVAHAAGQASLDWMRSACSSGTWSSSRKKVQSKWVGVLALSPGCWQLSVYGHDSGAVRYSFTSDAEPPRATARRKAKSGVSNWEPWRAGVKPGTPTLWPTGRSGVRKRPAGMMANAALVRHK